MFFMVLIAPYRQAERVVKSDKEYRDYTERDVWNETYQPRFVYGFENIDFEDTIVKSVVIILVGGVIFISFRGRN